MIMQPQLPVDQLLMTRLVQDNQTVSNKQLWYVTLLHALRKPYMSGKVELWKTLNCQVVYFSKKTKLESTVVVHPMMSSMEEVENDQLVFSRLYLAAVL